MEKQKTVKIHTAEVDNHTPVIALDSDGNLVIDHYGCFGTGPYLRLDEVFAALKTHEARTAADHMALLDAGYTYVWYVTTPFTASDKYIGVFDPNGNQLTDSSHFFQTITEALDYVLDMEVNNG